MLTALDLLDAPQDVLRRHLDAGHPFDPAALDDTVYHGISLGLPAIVDRLTWKKFAKAFYRDPVDGRLRGWNVRIVQDGLDRPWRPRTRRGRDVTFGHFEVVGRDGQVVLDYGLGRNHRIDPVGLIRDPLVALNRGSVDVLLGWTFLQVGPAKIGTPSYFALTRAAPVAGSVRPPRD